MASVTREEQLRAYSALAAHKLQHAGETLALRQSGGGSHRGNVPPWSGCEDLDLHGTLHAVALWARAQAVGENEMFAGHIGAAWRLVRSIWPRFVAPTLGGGGSTDEAPYDCAMVLRAAVADVAALKRGEREDIKPLTQGAARLLGTYLNDLDDYSGRAFGDPGFLAWCLADYARAVNDRALLAAARGFVDRAFGMKALPPFAAEPVARDGLFDFSSTTATRVLAVLAAEGATPFTGAWLRERVAPALHHGFVTRPRDENCWNACVATALGRAYLVSTDPVFLRGHETLLTALDGRVGPMSGTIGRQPGFEDETCATFYYGLAVDSLMKV
jgi:hypothetical protein